MPDGLDTRDWNLLGRERCCLSSGLWTQRWPLGPALLYVHLVCSWRRKHKMPYPSQCSVVDNSAELFKFGATFTVAGKTKICQVPWGASLQAWTHHDTAVWYVLSPQSNAVRLYPCNSSYADLAVVCGYAQLTGVCDSCWGFLYRSESCADSITG